MTDTTKTPNPLKEAVMATDQDFQDMKKAVCLLLDHAVYDEERDDETIHAVAFARAVLRRFPNAETKAAMKESRND